MSLEFKENISIYVYKIYVYVFANIPVHKFDIICLSETYLSSEISSDDKNLEVPGYNIVSEDHPSNSKRGGICLL